MKDVFVVFFVARMYNFESRHRRERGREFLAVWSEEGKEGLPNFCRLLRGTEINTSRPWDRLAWCDQGGPGRAWPSGDQCEVELATSEDHRGEEAWSSFSLRTTIRTVLF